MRTLRRLPALLIGILAAAGTFAQQPAPNWLEETMYSSGKINTVIAVVAVLLVGLAMWLFSMDRRIERMEQKVNGK
jgi:hypothetical protein